MPEITAIDRYEAIQIGDEVVMTARAQSSRRRDLLSFEKSPQKTLVPEYVLLAERPQAHPPAPAGTYLDVVAFRSIRSPKPLTELTIRDRTGIKVVPVTQEPAGILHGGGEIELPLLEAIATPYDAIKEMKVADRRAVVVAYALDAYELFMNHQIARAYVHRLGLSDIRETGHPVTIVGDAGPAAPRRHLFSMVAPTDLKRVRVTTLFESVEGSVAGATKICLCSSNDDQHTVLDGVPTLDQKPCTTAPPGHGTYDCF